MYHEYEVVAWAVLFIVTKGSVRKKANVNTFNETNLLSLEGILFKILKMHQKDKYQGEYSNQGHSKGENLVADQFQDQNQKHDKDQDQFTT